MDLFLQRLAVAILWYVAIGAVMAAWGWTIINRALAAGTATATERAMAVHPKLCLLSGAIVALIWPWPLWQAVRIWLRE